MTAKDKIARRKLSLLELAADLDLPLNFHPAATRASAEVTPAGAV